MRAEGISRVGMDGFGVQKGVRRLGDPTAKLGWGMGWDVPPYTYSPS